MIYYKLKKNRTLIFLLLQRRRKAEEVSIRQRRRVNPLMRQPKQQAVAHNARGAETRTSSKGIGARRGRMSEPRMERMKDCRISVYAPG